MNFSIKIADLKNAVDFVSKVISQRTKLPVLSMLKLSLAGNSLMIQGTDLDSEFLATVECNGLDDGQCLISASKLKAICNAGQFTARFTTDDKGKLIVIVDGCQYSFYTLEANEYPPRMTPQKQYAIQLDAPEFLAALRDVQPYISNDESRYVLNSVFCEVYHDRVNLIATDGRRLMVRKVMQPNLTEKMDRMKGEFTIVRTVVEKLTDQQWQGEAQIQFVSPIGNIAIENQNVGLVTKQIEGNYPNYRHVIPSDEGIIYRIKVDRAAMLKAIQQVRLVTSERSDPISLTIEKDLITLTAGDDEQRATQKVQVDWSSNVKPLKINFSAAFLLQAVESMEVSFMLALSNELNPGRFDDSKKMVVLMPMRIQ